MSVILSTDSFKFCRCSEWMSVMLMMVLILLEFSPTPFAIRFISQELNIKVPRDPKISPIIHFDRRWSSGRDWMMSLMSLMTLAILVLADSFDQGGFDFGIDVFGFVHCLKLICEFVRDFD